MASGSRIKAEVESWKFGADSAYYRASGRCLQAESLPLKAGEIADLGDVPRRLGLIISAAVFGFL
jgi:hypothetical protein